MRKRLQRSTMCQSIFLLRTVKTTDIPIKAKDILGTATDIPVNVTYILVKATDIPVEVKDRLVKATDILAKANDILQPKRINFRATELHYAVLNKNVRFWINKINIICSQCLSKKTFFCDAFTLENNSLACPEHGNVSR